MNKQNERRKRALQRLERDIREVIKDLQEMDSRITRACKYTGNDADATAALARMEAEAATLRVRLGLAVVEL